MAITPSGSGKLEPTSGSLVARVAVGVVGAIVLFLIAKWVLGFVFTIVKLGVFIAVVVGAIYAIGQFTKKD